MSLIAKTFGRIIIKIKAASPIQVTKNKTMNNEKWTFLDISRLDVHIDFDLARPLFGVPDRTRE